MKKVLVFLSLVLMGIALMGCENGDGNVFTFKLFEDTEEYITMVTEAGYAPYEYIENGEIKGVDIELGKEIAKKLHKNLRVINKNFDVLLIDIAAGNGADFSFAGMTPTPERAKQVLFSNPYYDDAENSQVVLLKSDSSISTLADLNSSSVRTGAQLGTVQDELLNKFAPSSNKKIVQSLDELFGELKEGFRDAIFTEKQVAEAFINQNGGAGQYKMIENIAPEYSTSAGAVKLGNTELMNVINEVIAECLASGKIEAWFIEHTQAE